MTFVILQPCCNDASCAAVCPVDCIHPTPDEAPFMRAEMLHIDPDGCIDCGACVDACPVGAIASDDELSPEQEPFLELNASYFQVHPMADDAIAPSKRAWRKADFNGMRVAIVGSGPSAFYAAIELCAYEGVEVHMFERLLTPYGLVRFGVAPDHPGTKTVTELFRTLDCKPEFTLHLGTEVGTHLTHQELVDHHHAVIYAVGASSDRKLGIAGEELPGSHAAIEFVAWYNGHPDYADRTFDLSCERAVVVGNGNVALDVARILLTDPESLDRTDIADHALDELRKSNVREVVVLGRRGVAQAGYTNPEMLALQHLPGVDLIIDGANVATDELTQSILDADDTESSVTAKVAFAQNVAASTPVGAPKRLVLRYLASPDEIHGTDRVEAMSISRNVLERTDDGDIVVSRTDDKETLETGLVLRSIGSRGVQISGVPFDQVNGIIPNIDGRVVDESTREILPGIYSTGWIKRGSSGVIGTNKKCATDTVDILLQDYLSGELSSPEPPPGAISALVAERQPDSVNFSEWIRIDKAEKAAGEALESSS